MNIHYRKRWHFFLPSRTKNFNMIAPQYEIIIKGQYTDIAKVQNSTSLANGIHLRRHKKEQLTAHKTTTV